MFHQGYFSIYPTRWTEESVKPGFSMMQNRLNFRDREMDAWFWLIVWTTVPDK
jgi:hypothetical protein